MSLSPEHAIIILKSVSLPTLTAEHPVTKRVIAAIPADQVDYQPDAVSKTAIELAWHIVSAEIRFLEAVAAGVFDLSPRPRPESVRTPNDVTEWYSRQWEPKVEALRQLTGEQLVKRIDFRGIFQFPAVAYVQVAAHHSIHHRGQLSMYLRPMGARVPSIYGESYDSRQAREQAENIRSMGTTAR
jgi:uncharacterized damage-inducible protein DinB